MQTGYTRRCPSCGWLLTPGTSSIFNPNTAVVHMYASAPRAVVQLSCPRDALLGLSSSACVVSIDVIGEILPIYAFRQTHYQRSLLAYRLMFLFTSHGAGASSLLVTSSTALRPSGLSCQFRVCIYRFPFNPQFISLSAPILVGNKQTTPLGHAVCT